MKKLLSFILVCVLIIGIAPVQAFATDTPSTYEFHQDGIHISVAYSLNGSAVTEKTTISEDNSAASVVERVITSDGTMKVYMDGALQKTSHSDFYKSFLDLAKGDASQISFPRTITNDCGISAYHEYVRSSFETIDVKIRNYVVSNVLSQVVKAIDIPAVNIAGSILAFVQTVCSSDTDYIDVSKDQYYVHDGAPNQDLECYHVCLESYNLTSSGERDIYDTEWQYYQYYI